MAKVKDLSSRLTSVTGLNPEEREEWRNTINRVRDNAEKEPDQGRKTILREEFVKLFSNMRYWKDSYQGKQNEFEYPKSK